jgi:carbonic anhydrase
MTSRCRRLTHRAVLAVAAPVLLAAGCGGGEREPAARQAGPEAEWGYSGATGPARWGELSPEYAACSTGRRQSPIDITSAAPTALPIRFDYRRSSLRVENNGHTIWANVPPGSSISLGGSSFKLVQFHFHAPSEHTLRGRRFPMELHMVHESEAGKVALVTGMIEEGAENPAYTPLFSVLPKKSGAAVNVGHPLDPGSFLPPDPTESARWVYTGSLTTPPCTEEVQFHIYRRPVRLSRAQIAQFVDVYDHNARPVQPRHGRPVTITR